MSFLSVIAEPESNMSKVMYAFPLLVPMCGRPDHSPRCFRRPLELTDYLANMKT